MWVAIFPPSTKLSIIFFHTTRIDIDTTDVLYPSRAARIIAWQRLHGCKQLLKLQCCVACRSMCSSSDHMLLSSPSWRLARTPIYAGCQAAGGHGRSISPPAFLPSRLQSWSQRRFAVLFFLFPSVKVNVSSVCCCCCVACGKLARAQTRAEKSFTLLPHSITRSPHSQSPHYCIFGVTLRWF